MSLGASEIVLSPTSALTLASLESGEVPNGATISRWVRSLHGVLLSDVLHREVVKRDSIPKYFRITYGAEIIFVEDPPSFWRLIYTIVHVGEERHVVVLEIVDHPKYDTWFPGRRRR